MEVRAGEGATVFVQPRNNEALDQHESQRGDGKWLDLEYLLKTEMTGLLMDCGRVSRVGRAEREEFRLLPGLGPQQLGG